MPPRKQARSFRRKAAATKKARRPKSPSGLRPQPERTTGLKAQLAEILRENRQLGEQQISVEQQISNLATLYVAVNSLHKSLDPASVVSSMQEIVANLIGSEEMAIFEIDRAQKRLTLLASMGVDPQRYSNVRLGEGVIGTAALNGKPVIKDGDGQGASGGPIACIPLRLDGEVAGVVVIFGLLPQKNGLDEVDFDLFDVLTAHAASALTFARMYSDSGSLPGAQA